MQLLICSGFTGVTTKMSVGILYSVSYIQVSGFYSWEFQVITVSITFKI